VNLSLSYDELTLLDDLLRREHLKKLDAFEVCSRDLPSAKFTARDFGIPQIEGLIHKIEVAT
jgi:hypothetical protein